MNNAITVEDLSSKLLELEKFVTANNDLMPTMNSEGQLAHAAGSTVVGTIRKIITSCFKGKNNDWTLLEMLLYYPLESEFHFPFKYVLIFIDGCTSTNSWSV